MSGNTNHAACFLHCARACRTSAPLPKFVNHRGNHRHELRKQRGTSKFMTLVPLFDLKFLTEFAASAAGTSNRRHFGNKIMRRRELILGLGGAAAWPLASL